MIINNANESKEKVCCKCGTPLVSTSKYKMCENCRRKRGEDRRRALGGLGTACVAILSSIPIIKHFIKK